jgi:predicted glycoside hydrolase/deacetylase ChbG (UPF0249 family)
MAARRALILNADDFGLSDAVNAGIARAHERGVVTSASLMARRPASAAAAAMALAQPSLSVGLHLDLRRPRDRGAVEAESRAQLQAFRAALRRDPTHIDSHHHAHDREPAASVAARIAEELGVPLRGGRIRYEGGFYGQSAEGEALPGRITVERLIELIEGLPPGWTEIGCHPGLGVASAESSYAREREVEVGVLCDQRVAEAIERCGVTLRSFAQVDDA